MQTPHKQLSFDDIKDRFGEIKPHIVRAFWKFHLENPHIYKLILKYASEVRATGRRHFGIGPIFERMRWYQTIETNDPDFKMNNNYCSCYARLIMAEFPEHFEGFFQTRRSPGTTEITK